MRKSICTVTCILILLTKLLKILGLALLHSDLKFVARLHFLVCIVKRNPWHRLPGSSRKKNLKSSFRKASTSKNQVAAGKGAGFTACLQLKNLDKPGKQECSVVLTHLDQTNAIFYSESVKGSFTTVFKRRHGQYQMSNNQQNANYPVFTF